MSRIGIIGCGNIAPVYARTIGGIGGLGGIDVAAVADGAPGPSPRSTDAQR